MSFVSHVSRGVARRSLLLVLSALVFLSSHAFAMPAGPALQFVPSITSIAGTGSSGDSGDDGAATSAQFKAPVKVAVDAAGNVYVVDIYSNRVRKIDVTGQITAFAGNGTAGFSGDLGHATAAELSSPQGIAIDPAGNVYISDAGNNRIRKVDTYGMITTIAGTGEAGFGGDGGQATSAKLNNPTGIAVDSSGNLYVADYYNNRIREIAANGVITTVAGNGVGGYNGDGIPGTSAELFYPLSVALDSSNHLYIGDILNYRLRKLYLSTGYIQTIAGNGTGATSGPSGDGGDSSSATVGYVADITTDAVGNIYYADSSLQRIRKIAFNGTISTIAGNGDNGYSGDGGPALAASFSGPTGIAFDSKGKMYVTDQTNRVVRAISGDPTVASFAATSTGQSVTTNVIVMVNRNMIFKSITLGDSYTNAGVYDFKINSMTGCPTDGFSGTTAGSVCMLNVTFNPIYPGHRTAPLVFVDNSNKEYTLSIVGDATGAAIAYSPSLAYPPQLFSVGLSLPKALVIDNSNNAYIADQGNQRIVQLRGLIAGSATVATGSMTTSAPTGVATDAQGNLFIVDANNQYVIKVTPSHIDLLSNTSYPGVASEIDINAGGSALNGPSGIAATDRGDLYIADKGNSRVVKVTAEGVSTVLSTGTIALEGPEGVAVDSKGNVFIADANHIVKVAADGSASLVTTGSVTLGHAKGVAVDPVGNLFIADSDSKKVIQITTDGTVSVIDNIGTSGSSLDGIAVGKAGYFAVADAGDNQVALSILSQGPQLQFSQTVVGHESSDGTKTVAVQNIGNASLSFTTPSTGSNPSYPDGFPIDDNAPQLCAVGTTLNPGTSCNVAVKFHPTQAGMNSAAISMATNIPVGTTAPQTISVLGTALPGLNHLSILGAPVNSDAGTAFNVTVTAADSNGGAVMDYTGTVHFKSNDPAAGLPADYTFTPADNGVHIFQVTLKTVGAQIVTVYDKSNIEVRGDANVQVNAGTPSSITVVSGDGQSASVGGYFQQELEAKVLDQYNNPVPNAMVNFTVPASGAGVVASSDTRTTGSDGTAYFYSVANGIAGSYQIVASVQGATTPAVFHLTNTAGTTITALTATPSSGATYGQAVTLSATVTPNGYLPPAISRSPAQPRTRITAPIGPATGTVSFYDGTKLVGTTTLGGDVTVVGSSRSGLQAHASAPSTGVSATATLNIAAPLAGTHSYTAVYAGDPNFTTSQSLTAVAVTVGQGTVTLTGPANQPVSIGAGQAGTITVSVAAQSGASGLAAPTGTITYTVGSGSPQQAQLANGQATLQVPSTLAIGSYSVQATYSGDSNYQPTTTPTAIQVSVVNTIPADFSLTANPSVLTIKAGETGNAIFTFTPVGGFTGTVNFACSGLPAGVTCSFAPATLTADGSNKVQTSQLTVTTQRLISANFFLPGALLGGLLFWQRRRFNLRKAHVLMLILGAAVIGGVVGCGSSGPQTNATAASVTVTAQATGGSGGTKSHTATFTLNVTN